MFGFKSQQKSKAEEKAGIQFLAALLVCYPEISSVTYDPKKTTLTFDFVVRGSYPEKELNAFTKLLSESIETYHALMDGRQAYAAIRGEEIVTKTRTIMFHVDRDVSSLDRGELTLMARLFMDHFGKALLVDSHSLKSLEQDFASVQSELLDQMLGQARELHFRMHMVGLREGDRVVVYNR
ncbi:hypothetical protein [Mitsuokella sp.]